MHIGELAERTGLSLRTIRHYDEVGLLPARMRTQGGFRVYEEDDVERLQLIKRMKPMGYSLEEMAEILGLLLDASPIPHGADLGEFIAEAERRRDKLARNLAQAEELVALLRGWEPPRDESAG
ncbi:MerR family transcriptional regulator [Sinomonas humi]|uniref:MerR family transcriptional regulator n=1 Tax=Sinomonas humi TaxID=1338436 RepID=UPI00068F9507|nr:MerR family transcriptional regulator [Sinomonas humi]